MDQCYQISPAQGVQLMSLAALLKDADLAIHGDSDDVAAAEALIADLAQEIALQTPTTPKA